MHNAACMTGLLEILRLRKRRTSPVLIVREDISLLSHNQRFMSVVNAFEFDEPFCSKSHAFWPRWNLGNDVTNNNMSSRFL